MGRGGGKRRRETGGDAGRRDPETGPDWAKEGEDSEKGGNRTQGSSESGRDSSPPWGRGQRSRQQVAVLIQIGRSTSLRLRRCACSLHSHPHMHNFPFPPGEVIGLPALLDRSGRTGALNSRTWISVSSLHTTAPQMGRHTDAAAISDLGSRGEHSRIPPQPPVRFSEY
ncbi:hypothetical protein NDU88_001994 [Pleurodeles waltl]|uniref:Uncharacterized protein n=1 Tax=Pleurodeles waltl TaxID=8319 RepID=A0AAV7Q5W6_PLEWA|nr:hypothetical protein NDU88_001994 [Pleurodeles waltl]